MRMCVRGAAQRAQQTYFFASIINSERASFHDANWAGDAVTVQRERSLTLICAATWVCEQQGVEGSGALASLACVSQRRPLAAARTLTIGRIESYSDCEILARRRTRDEQGVVSLSRR